MLALVGALPMATLERAISAWNPTHIEMWKSPNCGCCRLWVERMQASGFWATVTDVPDVGPIKRKLGVPRALESCHTARVGGYTIEGHVPPDVVRTLLEERPPIVGIAVPGMPIGSPGMEQGSRKDSYNVVAYDRLGRTRIYAAR